MFQNLSSDVSFEPSEQSLSKPTGSLLPGVASRGDPAVVGRAAWTVPAFESRNDFAGLGWKSRAVDGWDHRIVTRSRYHSSSMGPSEGEPKTCLVVEDDERLRNAIAEALPALGFAVRVVASVAEARVALLEGPPDLLVLDVALPDGRASDVLDALKDLSPAPCVVAISGAAGAEESFELASRGVRAYLQKPLNLADLEVGVLRALSEPPDLAPYVKSAVGRAPVHEVEQLVRNTMVREALALGKGNRRQASRVLGISRQLLQHILRKG